MLVGSAAMALATRTFRWEGFTHDRGPRQPRRRRHPDGLRRRDRARLHDRPGAVRHVDAGASARSSRSARSSPAASRRFATRCGGSSAIGDPSRVNAPPRWTFRTDDRLRPHLRARPSLRGLVRLGRGVRRASRRRVLVRCPVCDDASVVRLPSAKVHVGARASDAPRLAAAPAASPRRTTIAGFPRGARRASCARSCATPRTSADRFPEEARKIHYEEAPARADPRPGVEARKPTR